MATSSNAITEVVIALMGGGIVTAGANLINARQNRRVTNVAERKAPVEINLSSLEGAEKAVLSLGRALDEANRKIDELEGDLASKQAELSQVRTDCARLQIQLDQARAALRLYMKRSPDVPNETIDAIFDGEGHEG